jgi:hypothetical protein
MNASRIRKPAVPAVAGSIRRNSADAVKRPRSRASAQPSTTIAIAAPTRTGVSTPNSCSRRRYAYSVIDSSGMSTISSRFARCAFCAVWSVRLRGRRSIS